MPALLAIKEDKKDLDSMKKKTKEKLDKYSNREKAIQYLSWQIMRADETCEVRKIATKVGGAVAKVIPDPIANTIGTIFNNPITKGWHNMYRDLKRGLIKGGAAIMGINQDELFVYDFETGKKLPAFDNRSNLVDTLLGNPETRNEIIDQFIEALPSVKKIFKDGKKDKVKGNTEGKIEER